MLEGYLRSENGLFESDSGSIVAYKFTYPDARPVITLAMRACHYFNVSMGVDVMKLDPWVRDSIGLAEPESILPMLDDPIFLKAGEERVTIAHYENSYLAKGVLALAHRSPLTIQRMYADWYVCPAIEDGRLSAGELHYFSGLLKRDELDAIRRIDPVVLPDLSKDVVVQIARKLIGSLS